MLLVALIGCGGAASKPADPPIWERPGLMGHVRPEMGPPQPGDAAPDFELPRLGGASFRLSSLRGSWVVLHFTASWCPYCDAEIEHLGALADQYAPRNVKAVLIDIKEELPVWEAYAKTHVRPSVIALHDLSGDAAKRFAPLRAQPSFTDRAQVLLDCTLIVDPNGAIRLFLIPDSAHFDPTFAAVKRELERMMGEAPVLPAERVVEFGGAVAGGDAIVSMHVAAGYHVMSDRPSKPNYVATQVQLDASEGISFGEAQYPAPSPFLLSEQAISVFEGDVQIRIPFHLTGTSVAKRVTGSVRYQACTTNRCLFPTSKSFSIELPPAPERP